ncbi:NAD(P)-binding protein [Wolfiporia cocos MD-104 SS10]|uniref:NAD(P)-binding protein n=1 Tax=Wolfiporia cocos (strain MD-104) TaxID=742152 RepID=A0A2H3K5H1_WOLCO|nr:NAD(P)-binding protein [Wolfiporia cocos MD-104 SS10]
MPSVTPDSLIVVTGITGYIGSHVGLAALQAGYRVRGTVRSLEWAKQLADSYTKYGADISRLEFVIVNDLLNQSQIDYAVGGAHGIAHIAVPGGLIPESDNRVEEAAESNLVILRAAAREPSVQRVVFTSSSMAVIRTPSFVDRPLTHNDWNNEEAERFLTASDEEKKEWDWYITRYCAMKVLSEKAAWRWVEEQNPQFDIVSILPDDNFGPVLPGSNRATAGWVYNLLHNDGSIMHDISPQWFIDVRDDARLHILAFSIASLGGRRIWAVAEPFGWNQILSILRKEFPHVQVPPDIPGVWGEVDRQQIDNSESTELMGGWIGLEQSLIDSARSFGF